MKYLDYARQEVGYQGPSDNVNKYWGDLYPAWQGSEWCFAFVSWCLWMSGQLELIGGHPMYYCPDGVNKAKSLGQWSTTGQVGALAFYDWGTGIPAHIDIVSSWEGSTYTSIGGNNGRDQVYSIRNSARAAIGFWNLPGQVAIGGGGPNLAAPPPPGQYGGISLNAEQIGNAVIICKTTDSLHGNRRAMIVAIATAMQESTLRNLTWGDRDSVGLFQQRPSCGWGTVAQCEDPVHATTMFINALLRIPNWQAWPITVAAQTVQASAFPDAYAKWEAMATQLVDAIIAKGITLISGDPGKSGFAGYTGWPDKTPPKETIRSEKLSDRMVTAHIRYALGDEISWV